MKSKFSYSPQELEINKVLKKQQDALDDIKNSIISNFAVVNERIDESEVLLEKLGYDLPEAKSAVKPQIANESIVINNWETIVSQVNEETCNLVVLEDVFSQQEISENAEYMASLRKEFSDLNKLDKWDFAVAGISGTIAALLDYFFVTKVNLRAGTVSAGTFKSGVESLWDEILPPDIVVALEKKHKVPFDISTNTSKISQEVLGLNPKTHRFQSLGHDPLLGFIFGVKDLMTGELTAIDGNGRLIIQSVSGAQPMNFVKAVVTEFGHLLSDVNAMSKTEMKLSLPAPLMPLLQMVQKGSVTYNGKSYTIGDLVKKMYYDGYNFNHFIGMSIPVLIIEIIIRLYSVLRNVFSESYLKSKHKTDIMLFVANSILCAENVGKVVITKNPFAINYISWISTTKYTVKTLKYVLVDYKIGQLGYVQNVIDKETEETYIIINETWNQFFKDRPIIELT